MFTPIFYFWYNSTTTPVVLRESSYGGPWKVSQHELPENVIMMSNHNQATARFVGEERG